MMQVVSEGWWCENCEFFESEDDAGSNTTDQCMSCGCDGSTHISVEIVTKGLE